MKLVVLPDDLRDFIILHELVHTKVKNHGNDFLKEITKAEPKARKLTKQINQLNLLLWPLNKFQTGLLNIKSRNRNEERIHN
ncbi:MAG: DUF45 domain-containing protein [Desulfofustis sp.]|nr:DUF45 domain-containing protein [Desulfofustis sp.]